MPPAPFFADGLCTRPEFRGRYWWTSDQPGERARALAVCSACPVRAPCAEWALRVTFKDTTAIYGGMTADARRKLSTARRRAGAA
jgi:Transcription factor WhiB